MDRSKTNSTLLELLELLELLNKGQYYTALIKFVP